MKSFEVGLPFGEIVSKCLLLICISFFAFSPIIGWHVYGLRCLNYLTNNNQKATKIFFGFYIFAIMLGGFLKVGLIWDLADLFDAFMAIPNLIALIVLSAIVSKETNKALYEENKE